MDHAPQLSEPRGSFHADVRAGLTAHGLTVTQVSLQSGLYALALARHLRKRTYPLPDAFSRIGATLNYPVTVAEAWRREAEAVRPQHWLQRALEVRGQIRAQSLAAAEPKKRHRCLRCQRWFFPADAETKYCSRACAHEASRKLAESANQLQRDFIEKVERCGLTYRQAAAEAGDSYKRLCNWLNRPGARLKNVGGVARFLAIAPDEALRRQGGSVAVRQAEIVRTITLPAALRWQRNKRNRKHLKRNGTWGRGIPKSQQHKQKIARALCAYRQGPTAHPLGKHHASTRGWVQQILRSLKAFHPDATRAQLEEMCLNKLRAMGRSFAGRDEAVARRLIAPRPKSRNPLGGRPSSEERDELIFRMRRQGATWAAIAAAVNERGCDHAVDYLQMCYSRRLPLIKTSAK